MTANQALKTKEFYLLWIMLFINISCGLGLISAASPMAQDMTGMSAEAAALMVGILGLFNGFGRLLWAALSDYIGRPLTFTLLLVVSLIISALLLVAHVPIIFIIAMSLVMTCYGAGFSLLPAYLSDIFGTRELAAIHGFALTAWAMAGLAGPILLSSTYELFNNYTTTLLVFIVIYLIALLLSLYLTRLVKKNT